LHTGPEILEQLNYKVDIFCDFVGSGGTFAGCARAFKEYNTDVQCYVVEPEGAAILAGESVYKPNHKIQGGGYSMENLSLIDRSDIDGYIQISDEEVINTTRRLAKEEGIFGGFSGGANVAAALKLLQGKHAGKTIVVLICDSGLKYLSTDLWA